MLPEPSPLETIIENPEYHGAIPTVIRIVVPAGFAKRLNVSIDVGLLTKVDHYAKMTGKSRSQFLADAARAMLA